MGGQRMTRELSNDEWLAMYDADTMPPPNPDPYWDVPPPQDPPPDDFPDPSRGAAATDAIAAAITDAAITKEAERQWVQQQAREMVAKRAAGTLPTRPAFQDLDDFLATPDPAITYRIDDLLVIGARVMTLT